MLQSGNPELGSWEPPVTAVSSAHQYITLCYVCLQTNRQMDRYDWHWTHGQQHHHSCLNKAYIKYPYFLHKACYSLPVLKHYTALYLGAVWKGKITNKKHKNLKNVALNRPWKGYLFTDWELTQGTASPCLTSAGNRCIRWLRFFFASLHMCVSKTNCKGASSIHFGFTNEF